MNLPKICILFNDSHISQIKCIKEFLLGIIINVTFEYVFQVYQIVKISWRQVTHTSYRGLPRTFIVWMKSPFYSNLRLENYVLNLVHEILIINICFSFRKPGSCRQYSRRYSSTVDGDRDAQQRPQTQLSCYLRSLHVISRRVHHNSHSSSSR